MQWFVFLNAVIVAATLLYLPGYTLCYCLLREKGMALVLAPLVSVFVVISIGLAFGLSGVALTGLQFIAVCSGVTVLGGFCYVRVNRHSGCNIKVPKHQFSWRSLLVYCVAGLVLTGYYFVIPLNGPDSFAQLWDNAHHLNLIQAFVDSHRYSILQTSLFPVLPIEPMSDFVFYPAAWHVVTAVACDLLGCSPAMAENAMNCVVLGLVIPVSAWGFLSVLFERIPDAVVYGGVCCLAYAAFPWGFMAYGPLYPNLFAFALLPALFSGIMCLPALPGGRARLSLGGILLLGAFSLAASQPNAVFTGAIVMLPWAIVKVYELLRRYRSLRFPRVACSMISIACVVLGLLSRGLPMMVNVVNYPWNAYAAHWYQAFIDFVDMGFRNGAAQPQLACAAIIGIVYVLGMRKFRWLLIPYVFFMVGYVANGIHFAGQSASLLTGYWYNDADRVAACAYFIILPFSALGLRSIVRFATCLIRSMAPGFSGQVLRGALISCFVFGTFVPSFIWAQNGTVTTAFGSRRTRMQELSTSFVCLEDEEIAFMAKCKELVGDNPVLNFPFDGSAFAYATNGINTVYRTFFTAEGDEAIRKNLNFGTNDDSVLLALQTIGAKYLMLLDIDPSLSGSIYEEHFTSDSWMGMLSVADDTPGLELLLSEGDMRLYEIEGIA